MLRRMIGPVIFGLGGVAILLALGFWQLGRLEWKLGVIAQIEERLRDAPTPLPVRVDPVQDRYRPVEVVGDYTGDSVAVLSTWPGAGVGVEVIAVMVLADGRRVLVDRGFVPEALRAGLDLRAEGVQVQGNLLWPEDQSGATPPPDLARGLWFSRAVAPIAAHLGTEPLLIVARADAPLPGLLPRPIDTADVKNDHLGYAVTWFLLALVWAGMTVFLLWRISRPTA